MPLKVTYRVTRREVKADRSAVPEDAAKLARFLQADAKVPVGGKPLELIKEQAGAEGPDGGGPAVLRRGQRSHALQQGGHRLGPAATPSGPATASYGNCTDFHSLFISLARSQKIPAKFEIGFPLPEKHGTGDVAGYHCWAKFRPDGKGWVPVDISEANKNPKMHDYYFGNLTEDRVAFTTGRDLDAGAEAGRAGR